MIGVLVAACGRTSSNPPPASHPAPSATAPATTTSTTESSPPTKSYPRTTSHASTAGASNVRLPAIFMVGSGGSLMPTSVSAPVGVLIGLTLISADRKPHRVTVDHQTLAVPVRGRTYAVLRGLHDGRYPVLVDGARRGTLVVGGQVGP